MIRIRDKYELILVQSKEDAPQFSREYQTELRQFASRIQGASQRAMAMDSVVGGGGPLGEFIFEHGDALIKAVASIGVAWVAAYHGRRVRVKFDGIEIEAKDSGEVQSLLNRIREFRDNSSEE